MSKKSFKFGPFANKPECWYEHVSLCPEDPACFRTTCGFAHPERDSKSTRWEYVYPLEWFQPTQAPTAEKPSGVRADPSVATRLVATPDPFDWDLSATLGRDLAEECIPASISMPFLDEDSMPPTPVRASPTLGLPRSLDDTIRPVETTFLTQPPQGTSPVPTSPYVKLDLQADPVPKPKAKKTKLSKHAKPFAIPGVTVLSTADSQPQPPKAQPEKAPVIELSTHQPSDTARKARPTTPESDSSIDGFLERWKDVRSGKGTQKTHVDLSDDSTSQSDNLNFTLRGGRGDGKSGRSRSGKGKEMLATGFWAKLFSLIGLLFSFIAAIGDAIYEGARAFSSRLGAGRRSSSRSRRSPSPTWVKVGREGVAR